MKLKLVGARRYNLKGELYVSLEPDGRTEVVYDVDDKKGTYLLEQYDPSSGYPYFEEYKGELQGKKPGTVDEIDKVARRERPATERRNRRPNERAPRPAGRGMGPRNNDVMLQGRGGGAGPSVRQSPRPIEDAGGDMEGAAAV